jgi:predicted dehydrogenase
VDDIGVAIVGSGDMGGVYAEAAARHVPGARLVAISGGRRAPDLAAEYGVDHVADYDDLLERRDVDGVLIALPHALHRQFVEAAARARKHVLVEKPLGLDTSECDAMIAAARANDVDLSVILTMRFDTNMQAGLRLVREGAIGPVRMMRVSGLTPGYDMGHKTWIADPQHGGALLDWGSHAFDLLRHFAGADPLHLSAEVTHYGVAPIEESSAMAQIAYPDGVMAQLWMSYELPQPGLDSPFKLWVVGADGILELQRFGQSRLGRGAGWEVISDDGEADWSVERRHDPVRVLAPARQIKDWVAALHEGRPSSAPADAGRWAVMQVEAALLSSRTGRTVALPLSRGGSA